MLEFFLLLLVFLHILVLEESPQSPNVKSGGGNAGSGVPEDFSKLEEIT